MDGWMEKCGAEVLLGTHGVAEPRKREMYRGSFELDSPDDTKPITSDTSPASR